MNVAPKLDPKVAGKVAGKTATKIAAKTAAKAKAPFYDSDFVAWTEEQAKLLRAGRLDEVDLLNLIEEIESLGKSNKRGADSQLVRLLAHPLKWRYQPRRRSNGWEASIASARTEIALYFEQSPSLHRHALAQWAKDYARARRLAASQTRIALTVFPEEPPFTLAETLDDDFWPD